MEQSASDVQLSNSPKCSLTHSCGSLVLKNHILAEAILRHLTDVRDIKNFRSICYTTHRTVDHYVRRGAAALDFSSIRRSNTTNVTAFLTEKSALENFGRWEVLQHLVVSNTNVSTTFVAHMIISSFHGFPDTKFSYLPSIIEKLPLELSLSLSQALSQTRLQTLEFQECKEVDITKILSMMTGILWSHFLFPYWVQMDLPNDVRLTWSVVESIYRAIHSQLTWGGPPPNSAEQIETCGLADATTLRKIGAANCCNLFVDQERFSGKEEWNYSCKCPFTKEIALLNSVFGSFGVEVDVTFCTGYCNVNNAFLKEHDSDVDQPYGREDDYDSIVQTYHLDKVLSIDEDFGEFPMARMPKYIPRMPYDTGITYPDGRIFYFPDRAKPADPPIPQEDEDSFRLSRSAIRTILDNFIRYPVMQQNYVLWKLIDFGASNSPGLEQRMQSDNEDELASLHITILRQILIEKNTANCNASGNMPVPGLDPYDIPTASTDSYLTELKLKSDKSPLSLIQQLLSYPLPRRLSPPGMLCRDEHRVKWFDRQVALPDFPRGLCYKCNRELWLCDACNNQLRVYCGECMAETSDRLDHYDKYPNSIEKILSIRAT